MICKWCGETLKSGAKTCKRCHREIPPLSDCGGFYDLVPQARSAVAVPTEEIPIRVPEEVIAEPEAMESPVRPVPPKKRKKKSNTILNVIFWLSIALVVILLIQTISLSGKLSDANDEIRRLRAKNSSSQETQATDVPNGKDPKPTDPKKSENPEESGKPSDPGHDEEHGLLTADCLNGESTVVFDEANNEHLQSNPVTVSLQDDTGEVIVILTLELTESEDTQALRLEVEDNRVGWQIQAIQWHDADGKELKSSGIREFVASFLPDGSSDEETKAADTEGTQSGSVLELDRDEKMELTCTITGVDSDGDEILVILRGIVVE